MLGVAIERFAYRPLRDAPRIAPLITALGVSFLLENSMLLLFGASFRDYNTSAFIPFSTGHPHRRAEHQHHADLLVIVLSLVLMIGLRLLVDTHQARQVDARGGGGPRGGRDARRQRRLHDLDDVLPRLGAGRHRRRDGRARVQPDLHADGLRGRPEGVHRRGRRRDRLDHGRDARRSPDRARRVVHLRLHLVDVHEPDRVRDPDRGDDRAPAGPARTGARCRRCRPGAADEHRADTARREAEPRRAQGSASTSGLPAQPVAASTPRAAARSSASSSASPGGRSCWRQGSWARASHS